MQHLGGTPGSLRTRCSPGLRKHDTIGSTWTNRLCGLCVGLSLLCGSLVNHPCGVTVARGAVTVLFSSVSSTSAALFRMTGQATSFWIRCAWSIGTRGLLPVARHGWRLGLSGRPGNVHRLALLFYRSSGGLLLGCSLPAPSRLPLALHVVVEHQLRLMGESTDQPVNIQKCGRGAAEQSPL